MYYSEKYYSNYLQWVISIKNPRQEIMTPIKIMLFQLAANSIYLFTSQLMSNHTSCPAFTSVLAGKRYLTGLIVILFQSMHFDVK